MSQQIQHTFTAKVIRVVDGDTVELLLHYRTHANFRLAGIDAPEVGEPFADKAT